MVNKRYAHLFSPAKLGSLHLKNRVFMSPVETLYGSACGEVTNEIIEFYRRRAQGGVGLIVLHSVQGNPSVDPIDPYAGSLRIDNNVFIPKMSDLTEAVHLAGSKIAILVSIGGGSAAASEPYLTGKTSDAIRVAPSNVYSPDGNLLARELTKEEIKRTVDEFGKCAARAKTAGFDAFYIHAFGHYLLAEFLSPLYNKRSDEYGGSEENRWRLLFELVAACRRNVGESFPLVVRLSVDEMHPNGRSLSETLRFLPQLAEAGVDAFDVTAGLMEPVRRSLPPIYTPLGINWEIVKQVKEAVSIPIICSGKLHNPEAAEFVLQEGIADFVSIARGLIADPDWTDKVHSGAEDTLRKCLGCNYCIGHRIMGKLPLRCAFNPYAGREWCDSEITVQEMKNKHIIIIGGGPAGLEAATVLGKRGYRVNLYEATDALCGGQIRAAQTPPCKEALKNIAAYYSAVLRYLPNVVVHLNCKLNAQSAASVGADRYLVATGARPIIPRIKGLDTYTVYTAEQALLGECSIGERVVILGGGQVGAETAYWLSEKGRQVTVVDMLPELAPQEEPITRGALVHILRENGVVFRLSQRVESVGEKHLVVKNLETNQTETIEFDTALLALGMMPENLLVTELTEFGCSAMAIGDAFSVGNIASAISQAHAVALALRD